MLQRITTSVQTKPWQKSLACAVKSRKELFKLLGIDSKQSLSFMEQSSDFPLKVPLSYVERMRKGDVNDPLLRQVLPGAEEMNLVEGFSTDPVGDGRSVRQSGLLQKYRGRVLLMTTAACPIHCRYCFRRHFPYNEHQGLHRDWRPAVNAVAQDETISEVILSGGDPLSLADDYLASLAEQLDNIPHLKRLRIHSRYPVVLPERIDEHLLGWIVKSRLQKVLVIHCNHANEINTDVRKALDQLRQHNVTLLNQAVLLKGVNDDSGTLKTLSETLFDAGVLPYYLHMLDRVQGAAHFDVSQARALELMEDLRRELPGYLVPKLVREVAGEPCKRPVTG